MIENFEWNDVVLTCKGWYESCGDVVTDLAIAIEQNDNRSIYFKDKGNACEVASVLMNSVIPSYWEKLSESEKQKPCNLYKSSEFYQKIKWKMDVLKCSFDMAVIYAVHDVFCNHVTRDNIKLNKPIYGRGRRRLGSLFGDKYPISMTYKHMNDIASRMFDR